MDSAEDYIPDAARQSVYWHHRPATRYPYPLSANTPVPVGGAYSSQQMVSAANHAAPTFPLTAGFPGHSPLSSIPTASLDRLKQALHKMRELPQTADPPSLMASLIAIATAGVQVSRTLYSFANVIGGTSEEITSISKEISAFSSMLRDLHDFLDDAKDLISKRALINANRILKDCKEVFTSIQQMLDSCNAGPPMNFWQSLQWTFRRENVKPMCAKLESFKLTLATLLSTMKLAQCKQEIGDSKSPNTSSKERRYRANLQTAILNNSAAIIHWRRVEIEVQSARGGDPYFVQHYATAALSRELQWLSSLVPYKPPQAQNASSNFPSLPPIPETPDSLNEQAQVQIIKTIDMLLAKWTTLSTFERPKRPEAGGCALSNSDNRPKSEPQRQAVAESGDRVCDESEKESSNTSRHGSTGLPAAAPGVLVHPADSGNLQNDLDTATSHLPSEAVEPAHPSTIDVESGNAARRDSNEPTARPKVNITTPHISNQQGDEPTENSNNGNRGEEDEAMSVEDSAYTETDHTDSEPSEAYLSNTITPSESRSGRPQRYPLSPSVLTSDSYEEHPRYAAIPSDRAPPYAAWPYGPHGSPPNLASPYGPAQFAPLSYNHAAYGVPQHIQTTYDSHPVSYMSPPPLGIVPGLYPGFSSLPNPQSAPLAQSCNDPHRIDYESSENRTVRFKDAIGRKFTFPFQQCKRWADMETLIGQAFVHIDDRKLVDRVKSGHFDLMDPSGAIILPSLWETFVQPDWAITMHMWPFPKDVEEPTKMPPAPKPPAPPSAVPPPAPMAPSVVFESRFRKVPRERLAFEPRSRASREESDSVSEPISSDEDSDEGTRKSTFQDMLTESFARHGQQFEETWEAVMTRSRVSAQRAILEMWLSKSEAELRKLDISPSREQRNQEPDPKATVTPTNILEDENNGGNVPDRENRAPEEAPRLGHQHSTSQVQTLSPTASHVTGLNLCQSCKSPLFSMKYPNAPAFNEMGSFRSSGGEEEHAAPEHVLPQCSLEHMTEPLEDLVKRSGVDPQEKLDKAKGVDNEQHLSCLEKEIIQTVMQTPPQTPPMSEPSPASRRDSMSRQPLQDSLGNRKLSNDIRSSFRKRLFGRSVSSPAAVA